jgi:hypothetical protein
MLARKTLFAGSSREILGQVMFRDVAPPGRVCTGVPDDLAAVVMKLIARDRDDRYPTAAAAIEALLRCDHTPRDGRGELIALLAERFPRSTSARGAAAKAARRSILDRVTVPEPTPPGRGEIAVAVGFWPAGRASRPGRRILAIALLVLAVSGALALLARGGIARADAASMTETARP